jgi:hypothetical protein
LFRDTSENPPDRLHQSARSNQMKNLFAVVGVVALIAFVFIVALVSVVAVKGRALDAESRLYADRTIIAIVSDWDERALLDQAGPEFKKACPARCIDALFVQAGDLGALKHYLGAKGQANMNYLIGEGTSVTATYIARAAFEHGAASIKLDIVKREGQWRIAGFFVHLDNAPSPRSAAPA